jgi:ABC-type nitrate/sulfonate/bicarbonate transport system ATPase subunit
MRPFLRFSLSALLLALASALGTGNASANISLAELSLLYNPQVLFIPLPNGEDDIYARISPGFAGVDPKDVPCPVDKPCFLNTSQNSLTAGGNPASCPKGTVGLIGNYQYAGLDGKVIEKELLVCHICADLGSYCSGQVVALKEFGSANYAQDNLVCPEGSWCPNAFSIVPCPSSYYCAAGSDLPSSCPPLAYCPANSGKPSHLAKWLLLAAMCGFLLTSLFVRRSAAAASYYQDQSVSIYAQRLANPLRRWLAIARHRIWLRNSCNGPDPLHHRGISLELDFSPNDHRFDHHPRPDHHQHKKRRTLLPECLTGLKPDDVTAIPLPSAGYNILLRDLTITFNSNQRQVLSRVNLRFDAGKIHGLLGRTGVGKSVLLELLAGVSDPKVATARGGIHFMPNTGAGEFSAVPRHRLGFLSQNDVVPDSLSADEALKLTRRLHRCVERVAASNEERPSTSELAGDDEIVSDLERVLDLFSIRHNLVRSADQQAQGSAAGGSTEEESSSGGCGCLEGISSVWTAPVALGGGSDVSGGQRKRLALAMELLKRPHVLLRRNGCSASFARWRKSVGQQWSSLSTSYDRKCSRALILLHCWEKAVSCFTGHHRKWLPTSTRWASLGLSIVWEATPLPSILRHRLRLRRYLRARAPPQAHHRHPPPARLCLFVLSKRPLFPTCC